MKFTGVNSLYLPQRSQVSFSMKDIVVDSTGLYAISIDALNSEGNYSNIKSSIPLFNLANGYVYFKSGQQKLSVYNTGEPFSISGNISRTSGILLTSNDISCFDSSFTGIGSTYGKFKVNCPTNASLYSDISINQNPVNYSFSISDYNVGNSVTGILNSDSTNFIFGTDTFYYNSYETLLSPDRTITGLITANQNYNITFQDLDTSDTNNGVNGYFIVNTLWDDLKLNLNSNRTISSTGIVTTLAGTNLDKSIYSLFDGVWENNGFSYQDSPGSVILNYQFSRSDIYGNALPKSLRWSLSGFGSASGSYITGLNIITGGEYATPPRLDFTGYFYVTGIQQELVSLLFSSGCTGNLPITFATNQGGLNASGVLVTHPVYLSDFYISGTNTFYVADSYSGINYGTGYNYSPNAIVNTSLYGSTCYDVPKKLGYDQSIFRQFNTSGAMAPAAYYLTGEVLCQQIQVSGGTATGYSVTGIDITNIGSGYSSTYIPKVSFIRESWDSLTKNATGLFSLKQSSSSVTGTSEISFKTENSDWGDRIWTTGVIENLESDKNFISFQIGITGVDSTYPWSGKLSLDYDTPTGYANAIQDTFSFYRTYNPDPIALKKNNSVFSGVIYSLNTQIDFLTSQSDLDTLYIDYGNENNQIDLGDLDF